MSVRRLLVGVSTTSLIALGVGLAARAEGPDEGKELLAKVRAAYTGLQSYRFEGTVTVVLTNQGQSQSFETPVRVAMRRPDRVRSEMKNPMMGMQYVADGEKLTVYSEQLNQYMSRPLPASGDSLFAMVPSSVSRYATIDERVKSARLVRNDAIEIAGKPVKVAVVEVDYDQPPSPQGKLSPTTFWIEHARSLVLRESLSVSSPTPGGQAPLLIQQSTTFHVSELNQPVADSLFAFQPPAGSEEVEQIGPKPPPPPELEGKPAPDFALTDLATGKSVKLSALKGKVVLLDFWATWCGPCRVEMPRVEKLHKDFKTKGLVVYGVNVGEDKTRVKPFLLKNKYTFPILMDREKEVMQDYQVTGIPTLIIVDRKGTIHSYFVGVREDSVLRNALATLGIK